MFVSYQASHEKTVKKCLYYFKKMMHYGFVPFFIVIILLFISKDMISSQSQEWNRVVQTGLELLGFLSASQAPRLQAWDIMPNCYYS